MDKLIGLIIFLMIFVISKMLENAQRTQTAQKKKPAPVNDNISYRKEGRELERQKVRIEKQTASTVDYHASKDEIEEFLRNIGVIKEETHVPKQEPRTPKPFKKQKKKTEVASVKAVPEPVKVFDSASSEISDQPLKTTEGLEYKGVFNRSLLKDKNNLKNAFILTEILKPPLALRKIISR